MYHRQKIVLALSLGALLSGCGNQEIKAPQILCPLVGAVTGAGVVAAAADTDEPAAYVGGAILGGTIGYFFCREKEAPPTVVAAAPAPPPVEPPPPPPPPAPPEAGTMLVSLEGTNFDFDKATLRPAAITKLDHAAEVMAEHAGVNVNVEGHTDSVGSDAYNQDLSDRRAKSVVDYLVGKGVDASRLMPAGYGEGRPVATNDTAEGRAQNRRVDLVVTE